MTLTTKTRRALSITTKQDVTRSLRLYRVPRDFVVKKQALIPELLKPHQAAAPLIIIIGDKDGIALTFLASHGKALQVTGAGT